MALQRSAAEVRLLYVYLLRHFYNHHAQTLLALHTHLGLAQSPQEIEQIITACVKSFDSTDKPTRRSLSGLSGAFLPPLKHP
jgi:hypothetical protein